MPQPSFSYSAEAVWENESLSTKGLADVRLTMADGRVWHLWGRSARARELALVSDIPAGALPVVLGSGLGIAVDALRERGPVVVVDREKPVLDLTGVRERLVAKAGVHWLDGEPAEVMERIAALNAELGGPPVVCVRVPLYQRLDRGYYGVLAEQVNSMTEFQSSMEYPKFASEKPRILLLNRPYFLYREIESALTRLNIDHQSVSLPDCEQMSSGFVEKLLEAVARFKPDFTLTVNHFGLDREGRLAGLLEQIGLPLASWFVDSPQLILYHYPSQTTASTCVFTFDAGNIPWLERAGFGNVHYLPLATDPQRFEPAGSAPASWRSEVSFVGDSMLGPVAGMIETAALSGRFRAALPEVADGFISAGETSAARYLEAAYPEFFAEFQSLPTLEQQLACEKVVTFEAAGRYRRRCIRRLLSFAPLIAGDDLWAEALGQGGWRAAGKLDYYRDLPGFYRSAQVNFNCTSVQMKGAVNQRVFDVPACGGFLVTDRREQMDELFEPGLETVSYGDVDEIGDVVAAWLSDPEGRARVSERARRRIMSEHTYEHRLQRLVKVMRESV